MSEINRIEVDEYWADSTIIEAGKYPARKAYTSDFIRDGIRFQIDAITYKNLG